jgi:hypothetical protein
MIHNQPPGFTIRFTWTQLCILQLQLLGTVLRLRSVASLLPFLLLVGAFTTKDGAWSRHKNPEIEPE